MDIQLVDLQIENNEPMNKSMKSLEELSGFYNQQFKAQSKSYVEMLQKLEAEIENEELKDQQIDNIKEHAAITKKLEQLCDSHKNLLGQITTIKEALEGARAELQHKDWELSQAKSEMDKVRESLKQKEAEYVHVVLLVEKKNKEISDLKEELSGCFPTTKAMGSAQNDLPPF